MKVNIRGCARCGNMHPALEFSRLNNPADKFEYWAMCPDSNEPILLMVKDNFDESIEVHNSEKLHDIKE